MIISLRISKLEQLFMVVALFYAGLKPCLPVPYSDEVALLYPWWGRPLGVGKLYLNEIVFLAWLGLYGRKFVVRVLLNPGFPARQLNLLFLFFSIWCGLASMGAPLYMHDLGRAIKLLLNVSLLFAVVRWTVQSNNLPIGALILGCLAGTMINIYLSLRYPPIAFGVFRMSGQNTPGVIMGVAVHLAAWLFLHTDRFSCRMFALVAAVVFSFSCAFSFSRTGWFALGTGLFVWAYTIFFARPLNFFHMRSLARIRRYLVSAIVFALTIVLASPVGKAGLENFSSLVESKLSGKGPGDFHRWVYVVETFEILLEHPLGVGHTGFYDAVQQTETYRSEDVYAEQVIATANPHATFLLYATTGGVLGFLLSILLFIMFMNSLKSGLKSVFSKLGVVFFLLLAPVYLLIGCTVPYLFYYSIVLIVPTAVALGWDLRERAPGLAQQ